MRCCFSVLIIHYMLLILVRAEIVYDYDDRSYETTKRRCPGEGRRHWRRKAKLVEARHARGDRRDYDDKKDLRAYKYYGDREETEEKIVLRQLDMEFRPQSHSSFRKSNQFDDLVERGPQHKKIYTIIEDKSDKLHSHIAPKSVELIYDKYNLGRDAIRDGGRDGSRDSAKDGGRDGGRDVGRDGGRDGSRDGGRDGGRDSGREILREGRDPIVKSYKDPILKMKAPSQQMNCDRPNEKYESCFAGCSSVTCDNPRERLKACYPFCESGCICVHPYVRDDRTHKCVLPAECTRGLKGVPDLPKI